MIVSVPAFPFLELSEYVIDSKTTKQTWRPKIISSEDDDNI